MRRQEACWFAFTYLRIYVFTYLRIYVFTYLIEILYSGSLFYFFEFSVQDRRGWPDMPVTFLYLCKEK